MTFSTSRRDFLRIAGIGGLLAVGGTEFLTGCTSNSSDYSGSGQAASSTKQVTVSQWSPPSTFNILTAADQYAYQDIALVFASLTRLDENLKPVPELAQSWDVSDDGRVYTFHLNPKAMWHDGKPVTAADVEYTFTMVANPDIPASSYSSFASIAGFAEVNAGKAEKVSGIKVVDDHTVQFTLTGPDVTFLSKVAKSDFRTSGIMPSHLLSSVPTADFAKNAFWDKPVGSGPFKFVQYKPGQYLELEAFPDYVLGKPGIDKLFMRIGTQSVLLAQLQRGEVDLAQVSAPDFATAKASAGLTVVETPSITFQAIYPNDTKPYLKDKRVRQALYHALDRQGMVTSLLQGHGEVVVTPIAAPPWAVNMDVPTFAFDKAKAKAMLIEAGWDFNRELNIRLGSGNAVRDAEAPVIQQALADIGVRAKVNSTDFPTMLKDMQSGNFDLALVGHMSGDDPDYTSIWAASTSAPPKGNNFMRYSNSRVDELLAEGRATTDQAARKKIYDEYQQIIVDDVCMIWLYRANDIFGVSKKVSGFKPASGADPLWNIHEWTTT